MVKASMDFSTSLKVLRQDKKMAALIKKYGPPDLTRYHGKLDVFAALLRSIIYQQLSGKAAGAIHTRVLALFPTDPTSEALLKIRAPRLRAAGLSVQKISYVRDLARKFLDGTIEPKKFPRMDSQEIIDHLTAVKGIGEWTAQMLLIFSLHRLDILPTGDLGVRKGFQKIYGLRELPDKKRMERIARQWRAHASLASWYLWRSVDTDQ